MRKRWRWVAGLGLMLVVLLMTGVLLSSPVPASRGWTPQDFLRIRPGMTLTEVEAILGAPPGTYQTVATRPDPSASDFDGSIFGTPTGIANTAIWSSDTALIYLGLDPTDRVQTGAFLAQRPVSNPFTIVGWRAKRLWHWWSP